MSVETQYHWTCDFCEGPPSQDVRYEHGLPDGWISTVSQIVNGEPTKVRHACNACRPKVPRNLWHPRWLDRYKA